MQILGRVLSALGYGGGNSRAVLLGSLGLRLLARLSGNRSLLAGRLLGCVLTGLGQGGSNLSRGLLGLPSSLLDRDTHLPRRFVGHVPSSLVARLRGGGNLSRGLLGRLASSLLDRDTHLPRRFVGHVPPSLFARLRGGNLSRYFLDHLPTSLLDSRSRLLRLLLGNPASHLLRGRARLQCPVLCCFLGCLGSRRSVLPDRFLCSRSSRLLTNARLLLELFDGLPASLGLLRVHIATDQPLPVFSERHHWLTPYPPPSCHRGRSLTSSACQRNPRRVGFTRTLDLAAECLSSV